MRIFTIVWMGDKEEKVEGVDIADAFRRAGYGGVTVHAMDYCQKEIISGKLCSSCKIPDTKLEK